MDYSYYLPVRTNNYATFTQRAFSLVSCLCYAAFLFTASIIFSPQVFAQGSGLPAGFIDEPVDTTWDAAVGMSFDPAGRRMFVWEKGGKVWVTENGQRKLLIDISEEVGNWHDHGLLGFALHPGFETNGYVYLLYVVDRHYLMNFGTSRYNPANSETYSATIGRLTRYKINESNGNYVADLTSRKILIGETRSTGIPVASKTHGIGTVLFGTDGTLLISCGDGASSSTVDFGGSTGSNGSGNGSYAAQALADGIITAKEDVGAYRSQMLESINGKILRIDPETGAGIPSNPFYDPANPRSARSRTWALGLRNPFRMTLKPGTGGHDRTEANPGTLYVGDVGWAIWEEMNAIDKPGQNFGWPIFEGLEAHRGLENPEINYTNLSPANPYAPNPLYGQNGCTQQFFKFSDLIKQPTASGNVTFSNPCNSAEQIPEAYRWVHTRPLADWRHTTSGPSRVGTFSGENATVANIGASGSPVSGPQFGGSSSTGGVWYTGDDFPAEYQNTYFHGDYSGAWIRNFRLEGNRLTAVKNFINSGAVVVALATHPTEGSLYYINYASQIRKISYQGSGNQPPKAVASADKLFGSSPLVVNFTGTNSSDPEALPLTYEWDFGDGSPFSNVPNPTYTYNAPANVPTRYNVRLKVTDSQGQSREARLLISVNNTPPVVKITSPINESLYLITDETTYNLTANVTDTEHSGSQLTYQWQTTLHHNTHTHPEAIDTKPTSTTLIAPYGCDGETYYYRITLTVTDAAGLSTQDEVIIRPGCPGEVNNLPTLTLKSPASRSAYSVGSQFIVNANASDTDGFINKVEFFKGTTKIGEDLTSPYSFIVSNEAAGAYDLVVKATDDKGGMTSQTLNIQVIDGTAFYRAINLNGAALTIDGNAWQGSSAPDYSYSGKTFANQNIPLVPATDASRATMIRSSVWGVGAALTISAAPIGLYEVYLYVWEDNTPETYSVSLEGETVLTNYNSGSAGTWKKLGPWNARITDGTININTSGGAANLSGVEIRKVNSQLMPYVRLTSPADNAVFGTGNDINLFADASDSDGSISKVEFYAGEIKVGESTASPYTFLWNTDTAGNYAVTAKAIDNEGQSTISNVVNITVNSTNQPPVFTLAIPQVQISEDAGAQVINAFATGIDDGDPGISQPLTFALEVDDETFFTVLPAINTSTGTLTFTPAANRNGSALVRVRLNDGFANSPQESFTVAIAAVNDAPNFVKGDNQTVNQRASVQNVIVPGWATQIDDGDPEINQLLTFIVSSSNTSLFATQPAVNQTTGDLSFSIAANTSGTATLSLYLLDDGSGTAPNANRSQTQTFTITVNATATNLPPIVNLTAPGNNAAFTAGTSISVTANASDNDGTVSKVEFFAGATKLGEDVSNPYSFTWNNVAAGSYSLTAKTTDNQGLFTISGAINITVTVTTANQPPVIALTTPANGASFNAPATVTLTATASDGDGSVSRVEFYQGNTKLGEDATAPYTFTWNNVSAGTYTLTAKAIDNLGTTATSTGVTITVTGGNTSGELQFYRAINLNSTSNLTIDGQVFEASTSAANFSFTGLTFTNQGITLNPATDANRAIMIRSSVYNSPKNPATITLSSVPAGTYQVYLYAWEDSKAETYSVLLEGKTVQANYSSGAKGSWAKLGPFIATISDGTINLSINGGYANLSGVEIWQSAQPTFLRAINLNGSSLTIDGHPFEASGAAANFTYTGRKFANQSILLVPATDASRATMLRSSIYSVATQPASLNVSGLANSMYDLYLYVWEDNSPEPFNISVEGKFVLEKYNVGNKGSWQKIGPFRTAITDGTLNIVASDGGANVSGLEIWQIAVPSKLAAVQPLGEESTAKLTAYPVPTANEVTLSFELTADEQTRLDIFDSKGNLVSQIYEGKALASATYNFKLNVRALPDGMYIARLITGSRITSQKLIVAK